MSQEQFRTLPWLDRSRIELQELKEKSSESTLAIRAIDFLMQHLQTLERIKQAGLDNRINEYTLNIVYPPAHIMPPTAPEEMLPDIEPGSLLKTALYIHIPFCTGGCSYCHYGKKCKPEQAEVEEYLTDLYRELALYYQRYGRIEATSIYVGGGTPSFLTPDQINQLFTVIRQYVNMPIDIEISFEMHPADVNAELLTTLQTVGVNRLSMGVQDSHNGILNAQNRRHSIEQAETAINLIKEYLPGNFNLDFIFGLPDQNLASWEETLNWIKLQYPDSVTFYRHRVRPGTTSQKRWNNTPEKYPSEMEFLLMQAMSMLAMADLEYVQYPSGWFIGNWKNAHRYQENNWGEPAVGMLGLGQHSYSLQGGRQYYNTDNQGEYHQAIQADKFPIVKGERLTLDEQMRRTIILGIKMGISRQGFAYNFDGIDPYQKFKSIWDTMINLELIEVTTETITLTMLGHLFADQLGKAFFSEDVKTKIR